MFFVPVVLLLTSQLYAPRYSDGQLLCECESAWLRIVMKASAEQLGCVSLLYVWCWSVKLLQKRPDNCCVLWQQCGLLCAYCALLWPTTIIQLTLIHSDGKKLHYKPDA